MPHLQPHDQVEATELRIPWSILLVVFSLIPALAFIGIGVIEDSFTLDNSGTDVDDNGVHRPIIETDGQYYLIVTINGGEFGTTPAHNESTYELNEAGDVVELSFNNGDVGWHLSEEYTSGLERCPLDQVLEETPVFDQSCLITNNGILEDPIFLGYFPAAALTLLAGRPLIRGFGRIVETTSSRLVILQGEGDGDSEFTAGDRVQLTLFQQSVIEALLPWRKISRKQSLTPQNLKRIQRIRRLPWVISIFGFLFLILGTLQHWNAVETYGFDIWASDNYILGFVARMLYEAVLYVIFFPMLFYWLFCSIYLKHQTLTQLEQKKGFRFIRFSHDEAGGMGEFGNQSLRNVVLMLPLLMPIVAYIVFYPVTLLLIIGLGAFIIGLPALFLWPLLGARRAMVRMKQEEMQMLATHFERSYFQHKKTIKNSPDDLELHALSGETLQRSEQIYQEMNNLPTWPFSRTLIAKFASIIAMLSGSLGVLIGV
jgi:hypothetical protein